MKKILLILVFAVSIPSMSNAQDYNTGIGLRLGFFSGVSVKHFVGANTALEGILSSRWRGFNITGLYEWHLYDVFDADRLNFYYGFGAHLGFWNGDYVSWGYRTSYTVLGIDGILGLEYNFEDAPINLSLDWKPAFNIIGNSEFWGDGGALSVRYIF